jgi:hypothetical protein
MHPNPFVSSFQPPADRLNRCLNCEGALDTARLQLRLYLTFEGAIATLRTFSSHSAPVASDKSRFERQKMMMTKQIPTQSDKKQIFNFHSLHKKALKR